MSKTEALIAFLLIFSHIASVTLNQSIYNPNDGGNPSDRFERGRARLRCGQQSTIRNGAYTSRIVGGKLASISDFPWMVSLQRQKSFWFGFKAYFHSCGGSLLTPSWIVTAAHCLYNKEGPLRAVAGADNLDALYRAQTRNAARIIIHPSFDSDTFDSDIALIKVNAPFNLDSMFSPVGTICLEPGIPVEPYDIATICGFGSKAFHKRSLTHLYQTEIAIIDQQVCNRSFSDTITNNMLCAGGMILRKRDACTGDSGGPLIFEFDDYCTLVGIVSFGNDCATKGFPGVYTRVDNFYQWILDNIDEPLPEP